KDNLIGICGYSEYPQVSADTQEPTDIQEPADIQKHADIQEPTGIQVPVGIQALNNENSNSHNYDYITNEHDYNYVTNKQDNDYVTNEHDNDHVTNEHNDDHVTNEHNNNHKDSSISKNGLSMNQAIKPNLKDLQLIPIDKIPEKISCLFNVNGINELQPCGHLMGSMDSSTGNFIGYLQQQSKQTNINEVFQRIAANDPKRKTRRDQKFITEFDSSYHLPCERQCRKLLTDAFLSSKESLKEILSNNIITCSLTCNLWTGQNRMGYLRVTCLFINNNFQLVELVLTIKYLS
ncbi:17160_t:CDS:2, partial [Cetraspora pellucida]